MSRHFRASGWSSISVRRRSPIADGSQVFGFEVDAFRKHSLLNGLDEIGVTLQHAVEIKTFETKRRLEQPWLFS